jgi:hypothetical protein
MFRRFGLGNPDLGPSVILSNTQHKKITEALVAQSKAAKSTEELWAAYQRVYKDYPHWREAIKTYFFKKR